MKGIYRRNLFLFLLIYIVLSIIGCASEKEVTYWDLPTTHRMPQTEKGLHEECLRIRQEIVRQRALASMIRGSFSFAAQVKAAQNIAWLENRAAEIGCKGAFSSTIVKEREKMSFDDCFKKCKELTTFTNEQCFEKCKE